MKAKNLVLSMALLLALPTAVSAAERTVTVDGVNYLNIKETADKYGITYSEVGTDIKLTKEGVEVIVPSADSNQFYLNGDSNIGIRPTFVDKSTSYIAAKDWASLFNMALTFIDGVTTLTPTDKEPVLNDNSFEDGVYKIGTSWGNVTPLAVVRNQPPKHVTTPIIEKPVYESDNRNKLEDEVQR